MGRKILSSVTITGADISVNPKYLLEISQEFPFVEWGLLVSKNQQGNSRFPSEDWIRLLSQRVRENTEVNPKFSLHLCGSWLRQVLVNPSPEIEHNWVSRYLHLFDRMQLNFHGEKQSVNNDILYYNLKGFGVRQTIFQFDGVNNNLILDVDKSVNVAPFFDLSHGRGVVPDKWPEPVLGFCGYGGGLSPYNLEEQLEKLAVVVGETPIWVDVETGVRGDSYCGKGDELFNIHKVWKFLSAAKKWVI